MVNIQCRYCASINFVTKEKGPHIGAFCADCGKWIKWLGKNERTVSPVPNLSVPIIPVDDEDDNEEVPW